MNGERLKAIACEISRGGFSEERVFAISLKGISHRGVASRRHLWNSDGASIEEGEPPISEIIKGIVAARILKIVQERALVSIPDGEVITIPIDALVDRPQTSGNHVSVRS